MAGSRQVVFVVVTVVAAMLVSCDGVLGLRASRRLVLQLRARQQQLPQPAASISPNKLRFHRNASLVVTLAVGTPPQNVSVVLDTGSELSWLLCSKAAGDGDRRNDSSSFKPASSTSYRVVPCSSAACQSKARDLPSPPSCSPASRTDDCRVSLSYADASSAEGVIAADEFLLGRSPRMPVLFGCMSSSFDSGAPTTGLLGMNRGSLSFVTQTGIQRFAYCIAGDSGVLLLGGDASPPFALPLNYTPLIEMSLPLPYFDRVAYSVQLEGIRVGSTLLAIPKSVLTPDHTGAGQTMVDSGTQFTFLLGGAYSVLKAEFLRQTAGKLAVLDDPDFVFQGAFDTCFLLQEGQPPPPALPAVSLVLRGAEVAVAGEQLLYRAPGERRGRDGVWCLTFGNSDLVPMSAYVIGHHHQQNVWVEYDLENGRVGFAPVQCELAGERLGLAK